MSSGGGSLSRPRYSRARRAAVVAATASVLTGTAMALPAATFADSNDDPAPIVSLGIGSSKVVDVPDVGLPLPKVELNTDDIPVVSTITGAVGLTAIVDTQPQSATEAPVSDVPSDEEAKQAERVERGWAEPRSDVPSDDQATSPSNSSATTDETTSLPSSGRSTPATAVSGSRPGSARPVSSAPIDAAPVDAAAVQGVLEIKDQKVVDQRAAVRAAQVLGTEKSAPGSKEGLGLAAPLGGLTSRGDVDTMNLASRNGPASATGDWNLLPEVLYAVIPLLLAGAAVVANNKRNAKVAAASIGVIQRRRHAGK